MAAVSGVIAFALVCVMAALFSAATSGATVHAPAWVGAVRALSRARVPHTAATGPRADPVRQELSLLEADHAELLAHARAAVAAARDGQLDPVAILAGLLEERGQLPAAHQHAPELLAQAWAGGERR